jgi:hypothetical protein
MNFIDKAVDRLAREKVKRDERKYRDEERPEPEPTGWDYGELGPS